MPSFLSNENINYLKYELRKIYPEDRWREIQDSTRNLVLDWFKMHPQLIVIYEQHGVDGLNRKFLSDVYQSPAFIDNPSMLDQDNNLYGVENRESYGGDGFFIDAADPNIEQNQDMPRFRNWPVSTDNRGVNNIRNEISDPNYIGILPPSRRRFANNIKDMEYGVRAANAVKNKQAFLSSDKANPRIQFTETANLFNHGGSNRVNYGLERIQPDYQAEFNLNRINANGNYNAVTGISGLGSRYYTNEMANTMGQSLKELQQDRYLSAQANKWFTGNNLDNAIYNQYMPGNTPKTSNYFPYGNCGNSNTKKVLTQLRFGDVPVVSTLDAEELSLLGSKLYRAKHRPMRDRLANNAEETELNDDVFARKTRERFYLDEIYNVPESQITTVRNPRLEKSGLTRNMTRSNFEQPCTKQYTNRLGNQFIPNDSAGSCGKYNTMQAYPAKDFVPTKFDLAI